MLWKDGQSPGVKKGNRAYVERKVVERKVVFSGKHTDNVLSKGDSCSFCHGLASRNR